MKDEIQRAPDGSLVAKTPEGEIPIKDYLNQFVQDNPEILPARMAGGSGMLPPVRSSAGASIDLDSIRPGMSAEDMQRVREQIARVAMQTLRGE